MTKHGIHGHKGLKIVEALLGNYHFWREKINQNHRQFLLICFPKPGFVDVSDPTLSLMVFEKEITQLKPKTRKKNLATKGNYWVIHSHKIWIFGRHYRRNGDMQRIKITSSINFIFWTEVNVLPL